MAAAPASPCAAGRNAQTRCGVSECAEAADGVGAGLAQRLGASPALDVSASTSRCPGAASARRTAREEPNPSVALLKRGQGGCGGLSRALRWRGTEEIDRHACGGFKDMPLLWRPLRPELREVAYPVYAYTRGHARSCLHACQPRGHALPLSGMHALTTTCPPRFERIGAGEMLTETIASRASVLLPPRLDPLLSAACLSSCCACCALAETLRCKAPCCCRTRRSYLASR